MRSLTTRLILAFLIVSVTGILLGAFFIRQLVAREFDAYVVEQRRDEFVVLVGGYYAQEGSWDGIGPWLFQQMRAPVRNRSGAERSDLLFVKRLDFALVDRGGHVVLPAEGYPPGMAIGSDRLVGGVPVVVGGVAVGTVVPVDRSVFRELAEERYLARTDRALSVAAAVTIAIALILGALLARLITRPLRELTEAAARIASGDLSQRVPVRSRDELGILAQQFNSMSVDLQRANRLRRQMAADIAHDLRTPLTVVAGYLESLRDQVLQPTVERFTMMYEEIRVLLRLVDDLHMLSLADAGELTLVRQPAAPMALLERAAATYRQSAEQAGVTLDIHADPNLPRVAVDVEQISRVLSNLLSNALRHTPSGGRVLLAARQSERAVEFVISDSGPGIAPEHLPHIFDRFYRADSARSQDAGGSGLGLAIVKSITEAHGGHVRAESAPGAGASIRVWLPAIS